MMLFDNRRDAGKKLVPLLEKYRNNKNTLLIGLPRGGVVTAYEISKELNLPLDVTCPRKIGAPGNPEFAIGAITETGEGILHDEVINRFGISDEHVKMTIEREKAEAQNRVRLFRGEKSDLDVAGKTVIIVDDGLATGSTMEAAIASVKAGNPEKVVVAIPVGAFESVERIRTMVDEMVCLDAPTDFWAVGQFYRDFGETTDDEVVEILGSL